MGHCGEGVGDHYQLVEGEVEGLFWINRGSVTDMRVATIFIEPSSAGRNVCPGSWEKGTLEVKS